MEPIDNIPAENRTVAPSPTLFSILIGPHGLRSGWRFAIYVAGVVGLAAALRFVVGPLVPDRGSPLWVYLLTECEFLAAGVIPALVLSHFEGRRFGDYGLPRRGAFGKNFWVGAVWGVLAITFLLLLMRGIGVFCFGGVALHGTRAVKFAAFWGLLFLLVGLAEEFVSRGYSQFTLTQGIGFWPAALLLSAAFGAIHLQNQGEALIGALGAALAGLFWCLTLRRTGSLWFAVGMHASWDWSESFLYSVPDSGWIAPGHLLRSSFHGPPWLTGGSVGPEGSVLLLVLIPILWVAFDRLYPAKNVCQSPPLAEVPGGRELMP
jgi:membrane protease YdiL (CAAX protease family)